MFETLLVHHCSPTLVGLKIGNMFMYRHNDSECITSLLHDWNQKLNSHDIYITSLKNNRYSSLIYVYRESRLEQLLLQNDIQNFLVNYGYTNSNMSLILEKLRDHFQSSDFPHEIGIFLDYPLEDVKGFIENKGRNYQCVGCWKVYCNKHFALETFDRYDHCRNTCSLLHSLGYSAQEILKYYNKGAYVI